MGTTLTYGSYSFIPVPLMVSEVREIKRTGDKRAIGRALHVSLNGTLYNPSGGFPGVDGLEDDLENGVKIDGQLFLLKCNNYVVLSGYPIIVDQLDFQNTSDNKVFTSKYSLGFEFADTDKIDGGISTYESGLSVNPYLENFSESWTFDFADKAHYQWTLPGSVVDANPLYTAKITHNLSATGRRRYVSSGLSKEAYQQAQSYVQTKLGLTTAFVGNSGVLNLGITATGIFDHIRQVNQDVSAGTYAVSETWMIIESGNAIPYGAIEDFNITSKKDVSTPLTTVTIEGSIRGMEVRNYHDGTNTNFSIDKTKFENASGYWDIVQSNRLLGRVQNIFNTLGAVRALNVNPLSTTIGHNLTEGVITYNYDYNNRRSLCLAGAGAISETISVNDVGSNDLFTEIVIPGRAHSLIQDLGTKTNPSRTVNIEAVFDTTPSGCPDNPTDTADLLGQSPKAAMQALANQFELNLEANYTQVFITEDQFNWDITNSRATYAKAWHLGTC